MTEKSRQKAGWRGEGWLAVFFTLFLAYVGFGDGINYWLIKDSLGLPSPLTFVLPLVSLAFVTYWLRSGGIPFSKLAFALLTVGIISVASLTHDLIGLSQNVLGLAQLTLFVALLVLIRGQFAAAGPALRAVVPRGLLAVHYFLCGYVLLSFASWNLTGVDINIAPGTVRALGTVNEYYGFRPSGFGYESSWTAFGLATTFTGIIYLLPRHAPRAFLAMAAALIVLTSMTGYAFLVIFVLAYAKRSREPLRWVLSLLIVLTVAGAGFVVYRDRLAVVFGGADPSVLMRLSSGKAAIQLISQSFPMGVGYGNFQQSADYTDPFVIAGIMAGELGFYKSDIFLLNVVAELGVAGMMFLMATALVFWCRRHYLPFVLFVVLIVATGTILVQALLVLAAVVGLVERQVQVGTDRRFGSLVPGAVGALPEPV